MRNAVMTSTFAAALVFFVPATGYSESETGHAMRSADLKWGPAPPVFQKGAEFVVLSGDPAKEGPFTVRLKAPAGYKVAAHNHPTDELVTVVTGTFAVGMGDKLDESRTEALKPGDFAKLPAGMNHFAVFPEATVVQISSMGPFKMNYVNPADNPAVTQ